LDFSDYAQLHTEAEESIIGGGDHMEVNSSLDSMLFLIFYFDTSLCCVGVFVLFARRFTRSLRLAYLACIANALISQWAFSGSCNSIPRVNFNICLSSFFCPKTNGTVQPGV
jgi:hypothetical protein